MNIVVVDHVFLGKEHIEKLSSLGNLEIFDEPPQTAEELKARIQNADVVIVGWTKITEEVIRAARTLKMVSIWATSCHYADLEACKKKRIVVTHIPAYATEAVSEHVFALLLSAIRKVLPADKHVRKGNFDWRPFEGKELHGKTLGIIGTGSIGCRVAEIAKAFGMKILGYDKYPNPERAKQIGLEYVDLLTLLRTSDFITLHVTLTYETEQLIGKNEIQAMKDGVIIINTSQGKVIEEKPLIDALKSRKISYAGLDVFREEPPAKNNPLLKLDNVVLTPHIGFYTFEAARRCSDVCVENIVKFLEGHPQNTC
jgi:D-3-phosphoglycerate dehydrogenase